MLTTLIDPYLTDRGLEKGFWILAMVLLWSYLVGKCILLREKPVWCRALEGREV